MFIKQISVFLENVRGSLCEMTRILGEGSIDLMALSIADTVNFGIVRIVVKGSQTDRAVSVLKGAGYTVRVTNVLCVRVLDRPSGLAKVLGLVDEANISVEYLYSFFRHAGDGALIILRLSDPEKGAKVFAENGILMCSQEEIDAL
ncbi:MAG: hypothetical protein PUD50_05350 [Eubacteriales bacterium]|nr:hypothetical protein [Eubacteriales bacterium]